MQCGFGMLEAGAVRRKNEKNILIKNMIDVCSTAIAFWLFGFGVAYGGNGKFMGDKDYYGGKCLASKYNSDGCGNGYVDWFFQYAFAATAATIVSGAVAERTQLLCYLVYATVLTGLVYPTVVHWVWGGGFLADEGVHDFAGSGVVHMVGGCAGLIGAAVIGPRKGRFDGERFHVTTNDLGSSSIALSTLGVFILWTGWYGFNTGSTLGIAGAEAQAELVMINTTLAPAACGLTGLLYKAIMNMIKKQGVTLEVDVMLNCCLAGLVSITAGCAVIKPGLSVFIGIIGALVYIGSSNLLKQLKIDDVLDAAPVHFFCGAWGVFAVGLFADEDLAKAAGLKHWGALTGDSGAHLLAWQIVEIIVITLWVGGFSLLIFVPLNMFGLARVSAEVEEQGLDEAHHGGSSNNKSIAMEVVKMMSEANDGTNPQQTAEAAL